MNHNRIAVAFPLHTQRAQAAERAGAIGAGRKILQARIAFRDPSQQGVAMRNRFIARQAHRSAQAFGGPNNNRFFVRHGLLNINVEVDSRDTRGFCTVDNRL